MGKNILIDSERIKDLYNTIQKMKTSSSILYEFVSDPIEFQFKAVDFHNSMDDLILDLDRQMNLVWNPDLQDLKLASKHYYKTWKDNQSNDLTPDKVFNLRPNCK